MSSAEAIAAGDERLVSSGSAELDRWPPAFRPVVAQLIHDGRLYFGSDVVAIEPRHVVGRPYVVGRPFSSLARVRVDTAAGALGAYIKILKPRADTPREVALMQQSVRRDFEMTCRVRTALSERPDLDAVPPIACFPDHLALVSGEVDGRTLSALLAGSAAGWPSSSTMRRLLEHVHRIGCWLKATQEGVPPERAIDPDAMRVYLDKRLDDLEGGDSIRLTRSGRMALESYRDRLIHEAGELRLVPKWMHADFCPDNIIVGDGVVTVLDFMMAKSGTVYHDISHLYMHLDAMKAKPWFRPGVIDQLLRALLEGFEPGLDTNRPLFALLRLQHVICHLVSMQGAAPSRAARFYKNRLQSRHRNWLAEVAGLDQHSWTR
jgi:Phosphotransferase enzyme family